MQCSKPQQENHTMNRNQKRKELAKVIFDAAKPYREGHWQGDWNRMRLEDQRFWLIKADAAIAYLEGTKE